MMIGPDAAYGANYYQYYLDDNTTENYNLLSVDANFANGGNVAHGPELVISTAWHPFAFSHDEFDSEGHNFVWLDRARLPGPGLNVDEDPTAGFIDLFRDRNGDYPFDGDLASIKIFQGIVMTEAQMNAELAQLAAVDLEHLVARYDLIDDCQDLSGNGWHLSEVGAITYPVDGPDLPLIASTVRPRQQVYRNRFGFGY